MWVIFIISYQYLELFEYSCAGGIACKRDFSGFPCSSLLGLTRATVLLFEPTGSNDKKLSRVVYIVKRSCSNVKRKTSYGTRLQNLILSWKIPTKKYKLRPMDYSRNLTFRRLKIIPKLRIHKHQSKWNNSLQWLQGKKKSWSFHCPTSSSGHIHFIARIVSAKGSRLTRNHHYTSTPGFSFTKRRVVQRRSLAFNSKQIL